MRPDPFGLISLPALASRPPAALEGLADSRLTGQKQAAQQRVHLLCRAAFIWVMPLGQYLVARLRFCPEPLAFGFAAFWCPCRLRLSEYFIDALVTPLLLAIAS